MENKILFVQFHHHRYRVCKWSSPYKLYWSFNKRACIWGEWL